MRRFAGLAGVTALAVAAALYLSLVLRPPRSGVSPSRSPENAMKSVALRVGDRTRPFGRRSYTLRGTLPIGGEPGSRQPEQYALDRGTSQI